jgi:endonuclease III
MPSLRESFSQVLAALTGAPTRSAADADSGSPLELALAAALERSGDRKRASLVISALTRSGLLADAATLASASPHELCDALAEMGLTLPTPTARMLWRIARWLDASGLDSRGEPWDLSRAGRLRDALARQPGIGPTTAGAVLLALGVPAYPIDRATYRILARHAWIEPAAPPEEVAGLLVELADGRVDDLRHLAAGFGVIGRRHCHAASPDCRDCPLAPWLPESGPVAPDG